MKTINLTKTQKRMMVLKDALLQLNAKQFSCDKFTYFEGELPPRTDKDGSLQKSIGKLKKCYACAKGGLFLGYVHKFNNVAVSEVHHIGREIYAGNNFIMDKLRDIFSIRQLNLIEAVFEGSYAYDPNPNDDSKSIAINPYDYVPHSAGYDDSTLFGENRDERLRMLLKSMIKNGGILKKAAKKPKKVKKVK